MKRIEVRNKSLIFYKKDDEVDLFIEQSTMEGLWGLPEEVDVDITEWMSREQILSDIFDGCEDQAQQMRVIGALDLKPSFLAMLDNDNYPLARYKMQEAFNEGLIIEADLILVNSVIPGGS